MAYHCSKTTRGDDMKKICRDCGTIGEPIARKKGSIFITLILIWFLLIPAIMYSIWRSNNRYSTCSRCSSTNIIDVDSPIGAALAATTIQYEDQVRAQIPVRPSGAENFGRSIGRLFARK